VRKKIMNSTFIHSTYWQAYDDNEPRISESEKRRVDDDDHD